MYILIIIIVAYYIMVTILVSIIYFDRLKGGDNNAYKVNVYKSDVDLGVAIKKNVKGLSVDRFGRHIPFYTNKFGRIDNEYTIKGEAEYLFLGDSFTEGVDSAKHIYPHVFSRLTGACVINAGQSAASFAQMLIIGDSILKQVKPKKMIVQISPWLIDRSLKGSFDFLGFFIPAPYFTCQTNLEVYPAIFQIEMIDMKDSEAIHSFRSTPITLEEWSKFIFIYGIPAINNYIKQNIIRLFTKMPPICKNDLSMKEILMLFKNRADNNEIELIFIQMGYNYNENPKPFEIIEAKKWAKLNCIPYIDSDSTLWKSLPNISQHAYDMAYTYTGGTPPEVIDPHPNPKANLLIARSLANKLGYE